ncbi:MAG: peptidoglycan DD-metalloendopeptidase family protein [Clostridia bacterium]|nr:peptidoglycan DD-metalloendopeptidase family protein [Clostridia bacterium]
MRSLKIGKSRAVAIVAFFLAVALLCCSPVIGGDIDAGASSLSDMQNELNQLNKEQKEIEKKLAKLKEDIANKEAIKTTLLDKINNAQDQIDVYNDQVRTLNAEIPAIEAQLQEATAVFESQLGNFKDRIKAMYMTGDQSYLGMLLSADDFADYLYKSELVKKVSEKDNAMLDALKEEHAKIAAAKASIDAKKKSLDKAQKSLAAKQVELEKELVELESLIGNLHDQETELVEDSEEAQKAKDELEEEIKKATQSSGGLIYSGDDFVWPVPGYYKLSSGYKTATRPKHAGIDISSSGIYGKEIVAAAAGVVTLAGNKNNGYGIYITINHGAKDGKTYATLYGHCSKIIVKKGDVVAAGQVIGYVGSTGNSSGPHLHFEIRINGSVTNPMNYFS